jgi:plastocyanin
MRNTIIGAIVLIIVVAGAGALVLRNNKNSSSSSSNSTHSTTSKTSNNQSTDETSNSPAAEAVTITYSDNGFSPSTVIVKSGGKVTVKNTSSELVQFDSDPHPVHTDDTELNIGTVQPGDSQTITVTTTGSHGYHNHLNPSMTGTIVVK